MLRHTINLNKQNVIIFFIAAFSVAAIPILIDSPIDHILSVFTKTPLFLYNQDFTTFSIKKEQFNYFSFTRFSSFLFFTFIVLYFSKTTFHSRLKNFDLIFILTILYRILSSFAFNPTPNLSLLSYMVIAAFLYIILINSHSQIKSNLILGFFAYFGIVNALFIIWQAYAIKLNVGDFILRDFSNQPRGLLMDAVVASIYMTVSSIIILERNIILDRKIKILALITLTVATILTGSRGFLLLWTFYFCLRIRKVFANPKVIVYIFLSASLFLFTILTAINVDLGDIVRNFDSLKEFQQDPSSMSRKEKIESSIRLFRDNPIFGVGSDNYQQSTGSAEVPDATLTDNPHNIYAQIMAENGLVGIILLLSLIIHLIINKRRVQKSIRIILLVFAIGISYIGALGSLPLVVMLVCLLTIYRNQMFHIVVMPRRIQKTHRDTFP